MLDNLSDWLISAPEKFQECSMGFEPMTSVMPVHCLYQLSYAATQMCGGQFVGFMFSCKRNNE